jgi:hypothetical protein
MSQYIRVYIQTYIQERHILVIAAIGFHSNYRSGSALIFIFCGLYSVTAISSCDYDLTRFLRSIWDSHSNECEEIYLIYSTTSCFLVKVNRPFGGTYCFLRHDGGDMFPWNTSLPSMGYNAFYARDLISWNSSGLFFSPIIIRFYIVLIVRS